MKWLEHEPIVFGRQEAELARETVAMLRQSVRDAFVVIPFFAYLMYPHVPWQRGLVWTLCFLAEELWLGRLCARFGREVLPVMETWGRYLEVRDILLASSMAWPTIMWLMLPDQEGPYRMVVLLWLVGAFALACLLLAPCQDLLRGYIVGYWAYPFYRLYHEGGNLYLAILIGCVIYMLVQWEFLQSFHLQLQDTADLSERNESMLASVRALHRDSMAKKTLLEQRQHQLQGALQHMKKLAESDSLTGCYNQRALRERLDRCAEDSLASGRPWALAMLDLDYFKKVNDTFGHQVGDSVLCQTAKLIESRLPDGAILARYGGEEFAVLMPERDGLELLSLMEEIRALLSTSSLDDLPVGRVQTMSVGVAGCLPGEPVRQCLKRADIALYRAKEGGRNRVCLAVDEI
ncbi:diguanylate cyclase [Chromobacterium sp. CV08]|uniref:GGDEF domain-containing protein n=1 Tax=Chromobacterium sp. CV08 TaxID=3133274 RepID=UPI003DA7F8B4